ncbi:MAG TPA: hypothetical protein VFG69_21125 [Nannocystaceae bacterium]|nr:hypothetical protein [Nannocystaceae bacterium]
MLASLVVSIALVLAPAELLRDPEAKRLFDEAQAAFETGDYAVASERLEAAYLIEPEPALLYPWAQAERQLDHCESAIGLYERFLDSDPSERMATAAQGNIERCKAKLAETKEPEPVDPVPGTDDEPAPVESSDDSSADEAPPPTDGQRPRSDKIGVAVGATLLGVGGVGLAIGGTMLGLATGRAKAMRDASSNTRYLELRKQALKLHTAGIAVLAVGGALVAGGIIQLAIVGAKRKKAKKTDVSMFFDGRSAGLVWAGRF